LEYSDFPKFDAPAGLIFSFGQNLPVLFFGTMFSPAIAGLYAMANRLSQAPLTVVSDSVRRVFLQKAARINNRSGSLLKAFMLTTSGLALMGLVPLIVLIFFGEPLLGWLLGDRWLSAGRYLEIMAPWLFMVWVTAPANPVFAVLRRQKLWLTVQSLLTVFRLCAFGVAFLLSAGPEGTLQAFVIATVAANIITIVIAINLINKKASQLRTEGKIDERTPEAT
jgi:O-antigen/teichoic acid export membrane protein